MSADAADCHPILVLEATPGRFQELARRIRLLGSDPLIASSISEGATLLPSEDMGTAAVLVDVEFAGRSLKKDLARLRSLATNRELSFIAVGDPPTPGARRKLRGAGVRLAMFDPFDDATLRFQLNRAWNGSRDLHKRSAPRIPAYLSAQIGGGHRVHDGLVYNLSQHGAFLETPRALMAGARVDIAICLPTFTIEAQARVVYANVPGNLRRPNVPMGMAVRFEELDPENARELERYVESRLGELDV